MTDTQEGEAVASLTPAENEWLRNFAIDLAKGTPLPPSAFIPWKAADEIESLTRQLAEAREALKPRVIIEAALARCLRTGNPVGTDTEMVGYSCQCQVCRLTRQLAEARASLAESRRHAGVELSEENDRLIDQLAEVREKIAAMYEFALSQGDDAAIGLSHALDAFTATQ